MDSGINKISENLKEEIYEMISEMVEEQIFESLESIKGDIEEIIRLIFSSEIKLDEYDQFTRERITSLRDVFNQFKNNLKDEIIQSITIGDLKSNLIKEIKNEIIAHPINNEIINRGSASRKKVILEKPDLKTKKLTKKAKK
ncbi:MAG: hypothetical protein EAX96_09635 [Candidatus Lokiarchaeota archaeon]|nr:hypothetical protein [Candidatus Lokiarchaeota archaeon]